MLTTVTYVSMQGKVMFMNSGSALSTVMSGLVFNYHYLWRIFKPPAS